LDLGKLRNPMMEDERGCNPTLGLKKPEQLKLSLEDVMGSMSELKVIKWC